VVIDRVALAALLVAGSAAAAPAPAEEFLPGFTRPAPGVSGEYGAARGLYAAGRYREAGLLAQAIAAADPAHWGAWWLLGNCLWAQGSRPFARQAWDRALALGGETHALRRHVDALRAAAGRAGPPPVPGACVSVELEVRAARALLAAGEREAALRRAEAAVAAAPRRADAWEALGDCRAAVYDAAGARQARRRALDLKRGAPARRR
jgi:tetratricopeptide (TPR) repeat protein